MFKFDRLNGIGVYNSANRKTIYKGYFFTKKVKLM